MKVTTSLQLKPTAVLKVLDAFDITVSIVIGVVVAYTVGIPTNDTSVSNMLAILFIIL
jgi:hypothetical protein